METSTRTPTWTTGDRLRKAREWANIESRAQWRYHRPEKQNEAPVTGPTREGSTGDRG